MDKSKKEKILRKLRALQEKTIEGGCTEGEVEAAMAVMNQLMTEYNLTLDEVNSESFDFGEDFLWSSNGTQNTNPIKHCLGALRDFCEIEMWNSKRWDSEKRMKRHAVVFFGDKKDVELAKYLYGVISGSIEREANRFKNYDMTYHFGDRSTKMNVLKSFKIGMARRLSERMRTMTEERQQVMVENQKSGLVVHKKGAISQRLKELGMHFSKGAGFRVGELNANAYDAGSAAAEKVHLGHGIGGGKNSAKMIGM